MSDRSFIVCVVVLGILAIGYLLRALVRRGHERVVREVRIEPIPNIASRLIVFSGPNCDACERQKAVVREFLDSWPKPVELSVIDASADPESAWKFRVMTVPTTVVARPDGSIAAITSGVLSRDQLSRQLAS